MWARIQTLLAAPIVGQVDIVHLFLVTGLVLVSIGLWHRILAHLPNED
jgi:hypothetical protein